MPQPHHLGILGSIIHKLQAGLTALGSSSRPAGGVGHAGQRHARSISLEPGREVRPRQ